MAEDTVVDILHRLLPAAEALSWLHEGLANLIAKLNTEAPASLRFYVSMDASGSIHMQCSNEGPQTSGVETQYNTFTPMMAVQTNFIIGRFSIDEDVGVVFCSDDQYNHRGQISRFEIRTKDDIERVMVLALRHHWHQLLGMVNHEVYGGQYATNDVPGELVLVEADEEACAEEAADEEAESLEHLVIEPRLREW